MEADRALIGQKKLVRETIIGNYFSSMLAPGLPDPVGFDLVGSKFGDSRSGNLSAASSPPLHASPASRYFYFSSFLLKRMHLVLGWGWKQK